MGALLILLGILLIASEVMSLFGLMTPHLTPASLLLPSVIPAWGVYAIAIGGGLGAIWLGVRLMKSMLRKRYEEEGELINGYGESE